MTKRAALVLAGGKARRFQRRQEEWQDKALSQLFGKPLLIHVVEKACHTGDVRHLGYSVGGKPARLGPFFLEVFHDARLQLFVENDRFTAVEPDIRSGLEGEVVVMHLLRQRVLGSQLIEGLEGQLAQGLSLIHI